MVNAKVILLECMVVLFLETFEGILILKQYLHMYIYLLLHNLKFLLETEVNQDVIT